MTCERTAYAAGKLLLFGEHAAVYGFPAVGIALDRGITVTHTPERTWRLTLTDGQDRATPAHPPRDIEAFFPFLEEQLVHAVRAGIAPPPILSSGHLRVHSDLPLGSGFGSSAALCTALARLALPQSSETEHVWHLAHQLETFFHGTPSGIDTGLSSFGGRRAFFFSSADASAGSLPVVRECPLPPVYLVAGAIPRLRDTRALVADVRRQLDESPKPTRAALEELGKISRAVIERSAAGTVDALGASACDAQKILARLSLSTPDLDRLLARGVAAGAAGGKLSGAGGGGAFFLLCADAQTATGVKQAVNRILPEQGVLLSFAV